MQSVSLRHEITELLAAEYPQDAPETLVDSLVRAAWRHAVSEHRPDGAWDVMDRCFLCAVDPFYESYLIILPLDWAILQALVAQARDTAKTFGEFYAMCPRDEGERFKEELVSGATYPTPESYVAERLEQEPGADEEALKAEWDDLSPYCNRPPRDEEPFDGCDWYESRMMQGLYLPDWYVDMFHLVPHAIRNEFGRVVITLIWELKVSYEASDRDRIIAALEESGYLVVEDQLPLWCNSQDGPGFETARAMSRFYIEFLELLAR